MILKKRILSYADLEKFDGMEKHILDQWKKMEKRNVLTVVNLNDWDITKTLGLKM
jgi:replicative DNA helicase